MGNCDGPKEGWTPYAGLENAIIAEQQQLE
jgi:hypothetical protein